MCRRRSRIIPSGAPFGAVSSMFQIISTRFAGTCPSCRPYLTRSHADRSEGNAARRHSGGAGMAVGETCVSELRWKRMSLNCILIGFILSILFVSDLLFVVNFIRFAESLCIVRDRVVCAQL